MVVFLLPLIVLKKTLFCYEVVRISPPGEAERVVHIRTDGSHYIYEKDGRTYPVPFHGAKEIGEGLRKKMVKEMKLK